MEAVKNWGDGGVLSLGGVFLGGYVGGWRFMFLVFCLGLVYGSRGWFGLLGFLGCGLGIFCPLLFLLGLWCRVWFFPGSSVPILEGYSVLFP
jgi:hypothetical protein